MCLDSLVVTSFPQIAYFYFSMYRYPRPCSGIAPPEHAWRLCQVQMIFPWPIYFSLLNVFLFRPDEAIQCVRPILWFSPLPESFIFFYDSHVFFSYSMLLLSMIFPETWIFNHNGKTSKKKTKTTSVMIKSVIVSLIWKTRERNKRTKMETNLSRKFHAIRWRHRAWTQQMVTRSSNFNCPGRTCTNWWGITTTRRPRNSWSPWSRCSTSTA